MNKIICITGLCGAGKSVVSNRFIEKGFSYVRFGQLTMDIVKERGWEVSEENERKVREELREKHGMAAYALLNLPKFDDLLKSGSVIADGLYSFEEYKVLRDHFKEKMIVIAVFASPKLRYERLTTRKERPLTENEAQSRDYAEIEKLNKGGTIAMADFTVINDKDENYLLNQIDDIIGQIH
jgi:dephospho-CoA kinase